MRSTRSTDDDDLDGRTGQTTRGAEAATPDDTTQQHATAGGDDPHQARHEDAAIGGDAAHHRARNDKIAMEKRRIVHPTTSTTTTQRQKETFQSTDATTRKGTADEGTTPRTKHDTTKREYERRPQRTTDVDLYPNTQTQPATRTRTQARRSDGERGGHRCSSSPTRKSTDTNRRKITDDHSQNDHGHKAPQMQDGTTTDDHRRQTQ